jgi:quercetin 2,3-dioxygenase
MVNQTDLTPKGPNIMLTIRRSQERGFADHGWLKSFHSFSFAGYYDPAHMGFGNLRVINEDRIDAGTGFGTHGHKDMEIISYVVDGALAHKDSMGNGTAIVPGEVQRLSAGTGIQHSEFNHSKSGATHFFQIWIQPNQLGIKPGYEQKMFSPQEKRGQLRLVASPNGAEGSVTIHADAKIYAGLFDGTEQATLALTGKRAYVHVVKGEIQVNSTALITGDAALLTDTAHIDLTGANAAEVLVFDLSD